MPEVTLDGRYEPMPKQAAFHQNGSKYRLLVGGAGSGKSTALLWEAVKWCYRYPGVQVLLLRRNYPELQKGLISDLLAQLPAACFTWNDTKHVAKFNVPGAPVPSTIHFGHLEGGGDAALRQYLSSAFALIGIDEVGQFSHHEWEFLSSRNRINAGCVGVSADGARMEPGMMAATNPMGPGWGWVKSIFVDHKQPPEAGDSFGFKAGNYWYIHSTVMDNAAMMSRDPGYLERLKNLSPALREKLLYGNLDTISGQYYTNWDEGVHVQPVESFDWQTWERAWIGLDWGLSHHTAVLWFTRARHRILGKSVVVCYRERLFNEMSLEDAAALIRGAMTGGPCWGSFEAERKALGSVFASHELFARRAQPQSTQTIAAEFSRALSRHGLPGLVRAAGSASTAERIRGAVMLYEDIGNRDFFVIDSCPRLAEAIPMRTRDEANVEDVKKGKDSGDDLFDALKHGVLSVGLPREAPAGVGVEEKAHSIADPLERWLYLTKQRSTGTHMPGETLWAARRR
ncbi:MAG: hypothetical protein ACRD2E_08865 [Terriglobales bacterium]